jgi:uncharacterized membrane protein YkvA (DUF1232 family)
MGVMRGAATVAGAVQSSKGRHPLLQRIGAVLPMLRDTFTGRWPGAPMARIVGGIFGIAYVISPIDFIPELILGPFGIADDLALAAVAVAALLSSAEDYLDAQSAPAEGTGEVIRGVVIDPQATE